MAEHTAPPWIDRDSEDCTHPAVHDKQFGTVRVMPDEDYAHAAHCVNAREELVAMLTLFVEEIEQGKTPTPLAMRCAREAIAKAKGPSDG